MPRYQGALGRKRTADRQDHVLAAPDNSENRGCRATGIPGSRSSGPTALLVPLARMNAGVPLHGPSTGKSTCRIAPCQGSAQNVRLAVPPHKGRLTFLPDLQLLPSNKNPRVWSRQRTRKRPSTGRKAGTPPNYHPPYSTGWLAPLARRLSASSSTWTPRRKCHNRLSAQCSRQT